MNKVELPNHGPVSQPYYFPRLQVNKRGEIILAISKDASLTTGILVGKTPESKSIVPLGKRFVDWEVAGELIDYDGTIVVSLKNSV